MKKSLLTLLAILLVVTLFGASARSASAAPKMMGVNVLLKGDITSATLADLGKYGKVRDTLYSIDAVTMQIEVSKLDTIRGLSYVASANPDAERKTGPIDTVAATDFTGGLSTWDNDAVNVTEFGVGRTISYDGTGVVVAVLDTGLHDNWRQYFPQERIMTQYGAAFNGGGGENGNVSSPTNKWEHDQNGHGTHVTSSILGYSLNGTAINGVAPNVNVIPVKVLNQNGSGWSSVVARGITYVVDLKVSGALGNAPVVINMSLGGSVLDAVEKAAVDYAVANGVIIVAAAGNEGEAGMGYPGAYAPVISVAASGWVGEWQGASNWWVAGNVPDPNNINNFYITDFSSRQHAGQDLDVAAPGSWIVGPYQVNGQVSYYFLGGTSMASPHVAGIVALMAQKNPSLTPAQAEAILTGAAVALPAGCRNIVDPNVGPTSVCWGADATGSGLIYADNALAATP